MLLCNFTPSPPHVVDSVSSCVLRCQFLVHCLALSFTRLGGLCSPLHVCIHSCLPHSKRIRLSTTILYLRLLIAIWLPLGSCCLCSAHIETLSMLTTLKDSVSHQRMLKAWRNAEVYHSSWASSASVHDTAEFVKLCT